MSKNFHERRYKRHKNMYSQNREISILVQREKEERERERSQTENMGQTDRLEADKWLYVAPEILDPRLKALASLTTPCANTGRKQPSVQLTDLYSLQQQSQQKSV
jgi:hypothetical protein